MFEWFASPEAWIALATLTALEIVLGIDNIIFISILVGRLPEKQREFARKTGLALAMIPRLALLFSISWVMGLNEAWSIGRSSCRVRVSKAGVIQGVAIA